MISGFEIFILILLTVVVIGVDIGKDDKKWKILF